MSTSRDSALLIANRYAAAIFPLAAEADVAERVTEEFVTLSEAIAGHEGLRASLKNPLLKREQKQELLLGLAHEPHSLTKESLKTVATQGRAALIPYIAEALKKRLAETRGEMTAEITSARPLVPAVQKKLIDALIQATGKKVVPNFKQNPDLLGGVAIRLGSYLLDATLENALRSMATQLKALDTALPRGAHLSPTV